MTKHHRKPESLGGDNSLSNISEVSEKKHRAWHHLFNNCTPEEICAIINAVWIDPNYYFVVRRVK